MAVPALTPPSRPDRLAMGLSVAFNLVPIAGVAFWGWSPFALILLYWMENVIVGVRVLASMLASGLASGPPGLVAAAGVGGFFTLHYGLFCFVHGVFVATLFGGAMEGDARAALAEARNLGWGVASIALWQAAEFVLFLVRGEAARTTPMALMATPYPRIVVLHVTIILGGFLLMALGWPLAGLVLLTLFKTAWDVAVAGGWKPDLKPAPR